KGERRDDAAEDRTERPETVCPGDGGGAKEDGADSVRKARRPRVLERALSKQRLDELEIGETRKAEAAAQRQADDELEGKQAKQPPPARHDCQDCQETDRRLVEARSLRIDHVEVAVGIGCSHDRHYYTRQPWGDISAHRWE